MTDNEKMREDAIREAARNAALDEYFNARPQLTRMRHKERIFEAGFDRAWQAAKSVPVGDVEDGINSPHNACQHRDECRAKAAGLERLRKDAERYRWLRDNKSHTFSIERDGLHKPNYMTAAQFIEDDPLNYFKEYGDKDELKAMIETDTIWGLQVYPDTPIGFYVWHGATLDYIVDAAIAGEKK